MSFYFYSCKFYKKYQNSPGMKSFSLTILLLIGFALQQVIASPIEEGKKTFTSRCASCHKVDKDFAGPALAGIYDRKSMDWIKKFVHSSQTLIKSGDTAAIAIFEKFKKFPMPDHKDLTDADIENIMAYIKDETGKLQPTSAPQSPATGVATDNPFSFKQNPGLMTSILLALAFLIGVIYFALKVKKYEPVTDEDY